MVKHSADMMNSDIILFYFVYILSLNVIKKNRRSGNCWLVIVGSCTSRSL